MPRIPWRHLRPTHLLALAVLVFLAIAGVGLPLLKLYTYPLVSLYRDGHCTITAKEVQSFGGGDADPTYLAHFEYIVETADGGRVQGTRYDWFDGAGWLGTLFEQGSTDRAGEQAIVARYTVGATYRCWYDPRAPSQAVLTRDEDWIRLIDANLLFTVIAFLLGLVALALVLVVVVGLARLAWLGWLTVRGEPWPTNPMRTPAERRARAATSLERLHHILSRRDPPA